MSAGLTQAKRIASFKTPAGDDYFVITRFDGADGLSELFEYRIEAVRAKDDADLSQILGEKCSVSYGLRGGGTRYFSGILVEAQSVGARDGLFVYRFVLRPWLWLLSQRSNCKIFHNKTALDIIKETFDREGKKDFDTRTSEQYQTMEYCVQYRETDLDFVQRLMEQHGIYFYFKHSSSGHKLVLADTKSSHDMEKAAAEGAGSAGGAFPWLPRGPQDRRLTEHIAEWHRERRLRTGRVELDDYDFKQSTSDLKAPREDGLAAARKYELYDYPGKYIERSDGDRFAEIRVQAQQALDNRRYASGEAPSLYPGALCRLSGYPVQAENTEHLVVRTTHHFAQEDYRSGRGGEVTPYEGTYELLPSERRFRAPLVTPKPLVHGPQTAKVVGENRSDREEIDVDEYGCILVQFHWDRDDKTTSRRVRVAQVWSGKGWGGQIIPRVGQEVVVEFLEGDPDAPLVIGTVYNDQHELPYELPADKNLSGLKSNSTPNGHGYNEFKFDDTDGSEVINLHAEKDLQSVIKHAETREIGEEFRGSTARQTTVKQGNDVLNVDNGSLLVEASKSIVLKVGQSTITIEQNSVTIDSPTVTVKSMNTEIDGDATVVVKGQMITLN
jgi:type VI secretion system secreted protein VgrG